MFPGAAALTFLIAFVMEVAKLSFGTVTPLAVCFLGLFFLCLGGVPYVVSRTNRNG